ncbi:MAG: hypothetical protein QOK19_1564 [Solirubrobacteraceae bacterium]|jgi:hypothetical protein|nr:hypothetical protein [Solirubrobacterales bacterium]MEA2216003.1 hypothetical protein [Solirubrobacteraceae bacterium]
MHLTFRLLAGASCAVALAAAGGCGSSAKTSSSGSSAGTSSVGGSASTPEAAAGALSAEARSAATGDIPDNQNFLTFTDTGAAGYSIKYPEGWTQSGSGADVTFRSKNNIVHIVLAHGAAASASSVSAALNALKAKTPSLAFTPPRAVGLGSGQAIASVYTTQSPPNPVTNRSVTLIVDRYVLNHGPWNATVDLGTQRGVDNVDAYRKMINSFRWR